MENKKTILILAGIAGFVTGILFSPNKGIVNRLKVKKGINKLSDSALKTIEKLQEEIN
ncbi:YtxH domain-containing protein [Lacihabitans sp. LS3-19]|uniref:YtxH domain-containing protein n=1 Tax=Lacihabitans sp. LS3-19 TaxID=2487335 RepID=UPI0020CF58AE|nr:YtxH domain-containing protein [Lacihabitans sp. LS3-19]MCP9768931.1 YtxH domain-containing protein [Lacihabitans sp. LS3-19]